MTKLKFTKTRIVYWDSSPNTLVLPTNANTLPTGISVVRSDANYPYNVYSLQGTVHNWHIIPYNYYGLYCTGAELNSLFETTNSFTPISMGYTISHTIPLSKTATGTTTQLSFNNTIYSLIYDLPPNHLVQPGLEFSTTATSNVFFRTFDGLKYSDSTRNLLPKPNILFKVPKAITSGSTYMTREGTSTAQAAATKEYAKYPNFTSQATGLPDGHTQSSLVNAYLPEFLQDNQNVKALYPGENQDDFHVGLDDYKSYSSIQTHSINFNEVFAAIDARNAGVNFLNVGFPTDIMLSMNVVPECPGPMSQWETDTDTLTNTPYNSREEIGTSTVAQRNLALLFSHITQQKADMLHTDSFTHILPKKWIKCLPIVAQDNTVVDHTICATITWQLEVEITDRMYKTINPWKWEMVWPTRILERKYNAAGTLTSAIVKQYYKSAWSLRPLDDHHATSLRKRYRHVRDLTTPRITTNWNAQNYIPPILEPNDNQDDVPTDRFQASNQWTNTVFANKYSADWPDYGDTAPTITQTDGKYGKSDNVANAPVTDNNNNEDSE